MAVMRNLDQHLKRRGSRWYYQRRMPLEYTDFDDRKLICKALKTESLEVTRARRVSWCACSAIPTIRMWPAFYTAPALDR